MVRFESFLRKKIKKIRKGDNLVLKRSVRSLKCNDAVRGIII